MVVRSPWVSTLRTCRTVPAGGLSQCSACSIAAAEDGPPTSPGPPANISAAAAASVTPAVTTGIATARGTRRRRSTGSARTLRQQIGVERVLVDVGGVGPGRAQAVSITGFPIEVAPCSQRG